MNDSQALARSVSCLLDHTTPEASWHDFQDEWKPIITALTCKLLLSCGLTPETVWFVNRNGYARCALDDSFRWLNNSIRPDGTFGTDFWDAAQLAILVETFSLRKQFTAYDSLSQHLVSAIRSRQFTKDPSQWQGPGFYAVAIEYSRLLGHTREADLLAGELLRLQSHGCWQGHPGPSGPLLAVWHTAQCIITLSAQPISHPEIIARGIHWLKRGQHKSGAWLSVQQYQIYFTAYAVLALLRERKQEPPELRKALEYLKSQMALDGKCSDLGGTLMCAMALRAAVGGDFEKDVTLVDYLLARKNVARAEASEAAAKSVALELESAKKELDRYEKKYGEADFVITKKHLFLISLAALFLAILGNVAGDALNAAFHRVASPDTPHPTETIAQPPPSAPTPNTAVPAVKQAETQTRSAQRPSLRKDRASSDESLQAALNAHSSPSNPTLGCL